MQVGGCGWEGVGGRVQVGGCRWEGVDRCAYLCY